MSILGTLIDKTTAITRVTDDLGAAGKGVTFATVAHSLPHTNAQILLPVVRSIEDMAYANGARGTPKVLGYGSNASLATVGYAICSSQTCPLVLYDLYAIVFHSLIQ